MQSKHLWPSLIDRTITLIAVIVAFFWPIWGWAIIGVEASCLFAILLVCLLRRWPVYAGLSPEAQVIYRQYAHYYNAPFACTAFGFAAITLEVGGIVITVIGLFKGFWWGIPFGLVNTTLMYWSAYRFDPKPYIKGPIQEAGHCEIIDHIRDQRDEEGEPI